MAQGEVKWSSSGKQVQRFTRTLLPKGDYDLKFNAAEITQEKGNLPGKVPYINVPFEALGTATTDGGKNQKVFHRIFLHANPSPKDGKAMLERQGGVLDLAKAFGEEVSFSLIQVPYRQYGPGDAPKGEMTRIPIADPTAVLKWLKSKDGAVVRAHIIVDKQKNSGYDPSNKIDYFIPTETTEESSDDYNMDEEEEVPSEEQEPSTEDEVAETEPEETDEGEDMTAAFNKRAAAKSTTKTAPAPAKVKGKK